MNTFFKIGLLILGIVFLFVFYSGSQNGRYVQFGEGVLILDSHTGFLFDAEQRYKGERFKKEGNSSLTSPAPIPTDTPMETPTPTPTSTPTPTPDNQ